MAAEGEPQQRRQRSETRSLLRAALLYFNLVYLVAAVVVVLVAIVVVVGVAAVVSVVVAVIGTIPPFEICCSVELFFLVLFCFFGFCFVLHLMNSAREQVGRQREREV